MSQYWICNVWVVYSEYEKERECLYVEWVILWEY